MEWNLAIWFILGLVMLYHQNDGNIDELSGLEIVGNVLFGAMLVPFAIGRTWCLFDQRNQACLSCEQEIEKDEEWKKHVSPVSNSRSASL